MTESGVPVESVRHILNNFDSEDDIIRTAAGGLFRRAKERCRLWSCSQGLGGLPLHLEHGQTDWSLVGLTESQAVSPG